MAAAAEAVADAGLDVDPEGERRPDIGVYIGTAIGGILTLVENYDSLLEGGPRRVSPFFVPMMMPNAASGSVAIMFGLQGPNVSVASACATGSHAIGEAVSVIRRGDAEVMLTGGSEGVIHPLSLSGFCNMGALSLRNDEPERASRPFDAERDGFVMGEGATVLVLESLEHAQARGARIYAEFGGYGASADAYHIAAPDEAGAGAVMSMARAIDDAGLAPSDVDYVNAHGTSTPSGDTVEAVAIHAVFGDHAPNLAISSSKSIFGHLLGASGALESAVCIWALQNNVCPPTINLDNVDPECGNLNFVPNEAQEREVNVVMNNSFGFGGHNVSLILRKFAD
jgi:3-oxoacyl-[acyl-carrier-protein] synthase II